MERKKRSTKSIIKTGVYQGLIFAAGMAVFDHIDKKPFSISQFLFYFIFFGTAMAYTFRYHYKK